MPCVGHFCKVVDPPPSHGLQVAFIQVPVAVNERNLSTQHFEVKLLYLIGGRGVFISRKT